MESNILLTRDEKDLVDRILSNKVKVKVSTVRLYSQNVRSYLSEVFDTRKYLTVSEASIWLNKCTDTIYDYISSGMIVASRTAGPGSTFKIHVEETKQKLAELNNCSSYI